MTPARTIIEKIWSARTILSEDGLDLLHIDRSLLTDLSGTIGLEEIEADGLALHDPALNFAIPDHVVETRENAGFDPARRERFVATLERLSARHDVRHFARGSGRQGIVHVTAMDQGITLPGLLLVCGDSHTSTHGALGALAFGIGSTEVKHTLATQTLWMQRPRLARITLSGSLAAGVYAKDVALWIIARLGADWGREHAIEFSGPAIAAMSIDARATLCNMAVELGARFGVVSPDEIVFNYLQGKPFAPSGADWEAAIAAWRALPTEPGAVFDKEVSFDAGDITPQITWGTSPEQAIAADGALPPADEADPKAAAYIGLAPGQKITGVPVDYVFIGSCANGRIEDLRAAAAVVRGARVPHHVTALVVPGSEAVKEQAEGEGLHDIFRAAGFQWGEPGCSMCVGVNGDIVPPGKRCVSTSNRNFVGRQGPGARTHLASPATAAACAIAGVIVTAPQIASGAGAA